MTNNEATTTTTTQQPQQKSVLQAQVFRTVGVDSTIGYMFCGGVSGTVSRTCAAPFERLKILFQVQDLSFAKNHQVTAEALAGEKYNGIISGLVRIYKEEGMMGYFKGNGTNCFRVIPYTAAQFVSYEKYKQWMVTRSEDGQTLTTVDRLLCGGLAGMTSVLVSYPLDVVRCRLSAQNEVKLYSGIFHALKVIYQQEGLLGLYRGLSPTLMGIAPYVALNFTSYELLKTGVIDYYQTSDLGVITKLALGAVSGTFAQTITYPLDVIRRRMQMQGIGGRDVEFTSSISAAKNVFNKYGVVGFYKGLIPNYLKVVPVVSINFVVYEYMKKFLGLARTSTDV